MRDRPLVRQRSVVDSLRELGLLLGREQLELIHEVLDPLLLLETEELLERARRVFVRHDYLSFFCWLMGVELTGFEPVTWASSALLVSCGGYRLTTIHFAE